MHSEIPTMPKTRSTPWRIIPTMALVFALVLAPLANAQDLQPHNVIVHSSYRETTSLAEFKEHAYVILEPRQFHEPYRPPFTISLYPFEEESSLNIRLSGLTRSFGGLSELFLGEKGVLENAYLLFQEENYTEAEKKLLSLSPSDVTIEQKSTLLLAWIEYKTNRPDAALNRVRPLFLSGQNTIARESFYLASLIYYHHQQWTRIISLFEVYSEDKSRSFWDARFCLIQLYGLTATNRWKTAIDFMKQMEIRRFRHTKQYFKFYEIAGVAHFKRKQYRQSLENLELAHSLNPGLAYRKRINRYIAWLHYYLDQHQVVLDKTDQWIPMLLIEQNNELYYLRLSSLIRLEQWQQVQKTFRQIESDSAFYNYAAFKMQVSGSLQSFDTGIQETLSAIQYDFAEMRFQSALKDGNRAFKAGRFAEAEKHYIKAMTADIQTGEYHLAHYNLGLTHLKMGAFEKARRGFANLDQSLPTEQRDNLLYHLLYSLYQLGETDSYLRHLKAVEPINLHPNQRYELAFMKGNILLTQNRHKEAQDLFFDLWKQYQSQSAFESGTTAVYLTKQYESVLRLLKQNPTIQSEKLFLLEVRSLLGLQRFEAALKRTEETAYRSDAITELLLEVWMANHLFQRVVDHVEQLLKQSLDPQRRLLYYLSLGDAYFNLKQYAKSKNQFYKALDLTNNPLKTSLIQYNIALIAYYSQDYQSFVKETNMILSKTSLTPEIRYNLTQLLVDYYQDQDKPQQADAILAAYIDQYAFQRTKAKLKRLQLLHRNELYEKCFSLAKENDSEASFYQRRDRLVLLGYCGTQSDHNEVVIDTLQSELNRHSKTYRNDEINYLLAQAHFNTGNYDRSSRLVEQIDAASLDKSAGQKTRLLHVSSLVNLERYDNAKQELGDINQYRHTPGYSLALKLQAQIDQSQGDIDHSIRRLLRVYYMDSTPPSEKQYSLLQISKLLMENDRTEEAQSYLERIDPTQFEENSPYKTSYQALKTRLKNNAPQKNSDAMPDSP